MPRRRPSGCLPQASPLPRTTTSALCPSSRQAGPQPWVVRGCEPTAAPLKLDALAGSPQDWHAVDALKSKTPPALPLPLPLLPPRIGGPPTERVQAAGRARRPALAADVAQLVDTLLSSITAGSGPAPTSAAGKPAAGGRGPAPPTKPLSSATSLTACLEVLATPDALALATDTTLTTLLNGLHPLLHFSAAARQWGTPGLGALLAALQVSCEVGAGGV